MLTIKTLGQLDILIDDESYLDRIGVKGALLLIYLAEENTRQEISDFAHLLWPTVDIDVATLRLRSLLTRMQRDGFDRYLKIKSTQVALTRVHGVDYDADRLRQLTTDPEQTDIEVLKSAVALYAGPFLQHCPLEDYLSLATWVQGIANEISQQATAAIAVLVRQAIAAGDIEAGLDQAARLALIHPYDDESQIVYIRSLLAANYPDVALSHYQHYRRYLREDRGITEVDPQLVDLIVQVESMKSVPSQSNLAVSTAPTAHTPLTDAHTFSEGREKHVRSLHQTKPLYSPHPLFGRHSETAQLIQYLNEGHRLISIIGIGGAGKTFFVRSQWEMLNERFHSNVHFVDLRSAESSNGAEDAILRAIRVSLIPSSPAKESLFSQIVHTLHDGTHCLILDNFETVIDAALLLINLIQAVPRLTIIVTTRAALYLSNESRLHLTGLSVEDRRRRPRTDDGVDSEAVGFFVHCVRRFRPDFKPDAESMQEIRTICRLVAGVPLAIELAALQLDVFSLPELRLRLSQDVDVLTTGADDLPGNHHSMSALLDGMWQSIDYEAQKTLAVLSLFANSWHRDAMEVVASAPRSVYTTLLNASMLQVDEPSWFSMHPLIKQYAATRLHTDFDVKEAARRHAVHFLGLLDLGEYPLDWAKCHHPATLSMLQRRIYDLEISWLWAIAHGEWSLLDKAVVSLTHLHILSGQSNSGSRLLTELINALPAPTERTPLQTQLAGRVALFLSYLGILQGDLETSKPWAEQALTWLDAAGTAYDQAVVRFHYLWRALQFVDEMDFAVTLVPKALELATEHGYVLLSSRILLMTALMWNIPAGEWAKAEKNAREALTAIVESPPFVKDVVVNAASVFCCCLCMTDAALLLDNSSELILLPAQNEEIQYYDTSSIFSRYLHAILLADRGAITEAVAEMIETLPLYLNYYVGQASLAYGFLALCQARQGNLSTAIETARTGLTHSETLGGHYLIAYAKLRLAEILILCGQHEEALPLFHAALTVGIQIGETTLVFSSLYGITLLHKNTLPRPLYEYILKIGAVSPAMYHEMHPLTRERLHAEGIILTEEERRRLYATDLKTTKELVDAVIGSGKAVKESSQGRKTH